MARASRLIHPDSIHDERSVATKSVGVEEQAHERVRIAEVSQELTIDSGSIERERKWHVGLACDLPDDLTGLHDFLLHLVLVETPEIGV
jgi:hypothetical protein